MLRSTLLLCLGLVGFTYVTSQSFEIDDGEESQFQQLRACESNTTGTLGGQECDVRARNNLRRNRRHCPDNRLFEVILTLNSFTRRLRNRNGGRLSAQRHLRTMANRMHNFNPDFPRGSGAKCVHEVIVTGVHCPIRIRARLAYRNQYCLVPWIPDWTNHPPVKVLVWQNHCYFEDDIDFETSDFDGK